MLRMLMLSTALAFTPLAAAPAFAQEMANPGWMHAQHHPGKITLSATGESRVAPDLAVVSGGVTTEAPTASAAMQANNAAMNQVFAALRRAGVAEADIQTSRLNVSPVRSYEDRSAPRITGYQATNIVSARVTDLTTVGAVIDAMMGAGVNELQGVNFSVRDQAAALRSARAEAVRNLRLAADTYAGALGVSLGRILEFTESSGYSPPQPMARFAMAEAADTGTPVASGQVSISVSVTASYAIEE